MKTCFSFGATFVSFDQTSEPCVCEDHGKFRTALFSEGIDSGCDLYSEWSNDNTEIE
jgi:hypothetical protein